MIVPGTLGGGQFDNVGYVSRFIADWKAVDISLTQRSGQVGVFGRAAPATLYDAYGRPVNVANGQPRFSVFNRLHSGLLIESGATNIILQSQNPLTTWTVNALTVTGGAAAAPDLTTTAGLLKPDATSSAFHALQQSSLALTSGEFVSGQMWIKPAGYPAVRCTMRDGPGSNFLDITVDLNTLASSTFVAGGGSVSGSKVIGITSGPLAGWVWIGWWGKLGAVTTANMQVWVYDTKAHADAQTAFTGDALSGVLFWGAQMERNGTTIPKPPTSYIPTTTTTVTRSAETLNWPWNVTLAPQPMWVYFRFIDLGAFACPSGNVFNLTLSTSGANPRFLLDDGGGTSTCYHQVGAGSTSSTVSPAQGFGDEMEVLGQLFSDGSTQIRVSKNLAADLVGARGAALAFATNWGATPTFDVSGSGAGNVPTSLIKRFKLALGAPPAGGIPAVRDA